MPFFLWLTCPYEKGTISKGKFIKLKLPQFSGGKYSALVFSGLSHKFPKILLLNPGRKSLIPRVSREKPSHLGGFASFRPPASTAVNGAHFEVFVVEPKKKAAVFFLTNACLWS